MEFVKVVFLLKILLGLATKDALDFDASFALDELDENKIAVNRAGALATGKPTAAAAVRLTEPQKFTATCVNTVALTADIAGFSNDG